MLRSLSCEKDAGQSLGNQRFRDLGTCGSSVGSSLLGQVLVMTKTHNDCRKACGTCKNRFECSILPGTKSSSPIIEPRPTSSGTEPSKIDPHQAFNAFFQFATTTTDKFSIPVQSFQHRLETHQGPPLLNFIVPTSSPAPMVYLKKRHLARSSSKRRLSCLDLTGSREIWNVMEEISA